MKKSGHIEMNDLTRYFLNSMSREEETAVQEHLSECSECRKKIHDMRKLKIEFDDVDHIHDTKHFFIRLTHSSWTRAAVTLIIIAAAGITLYQVSSKRNPGDATLFNNQEKNPVMAIDTFFPPKDTAKTTEYYEYHYDDSEVINHQ